MRSNECLVIRRALTAQVKDLKEQKDKTTEEYICLKCEFDESVRKNEETIQRLRDEIKGFIAKPQKLIRLELKTELLVHNKRDESPIKTPRSSAIASSKHAQSPEQPPLPPAQSQGAIEILSSVISAIQVFKTDSTL